MTNYTPRNIFDFAGQSLRAANGGTYRATLNSRGGWDIRIDGKLTLDAADVFTACRLLNDACATPVKD